MGSAAWLIQREVTYGGLITDVPRTLVSPLDPRTRDQLAIGGMTGGDRMLHNGYAPVYAQYLRHFLLQEPLTLAEFGILKGSGLAIWCDLFPRSRIVGLDIDPSHFDHNMPSLLRRGAFTNNQPSVHKYDQLVDGTDILADILGGVKLNIVIDGGLHSLEAISLTFRSVQPHLAERFVYFIEDYAGLLEQCGDLFKGYNARAYGLMTVISAGLPLSE